MMKDRSRFRDIGATLVVIALLVSGAIVLAGLALFAWFSYTGQFGGGASH